MATAKIVPYGRETMKRAVEEMYRDFGLDLAPEEFKIGDPPEVDAEQEAAAEQVVGQVAAFWQDLGVEFPREALADRL